MAACVHRAASAQTCLTQSNHRCSSTQRSELSRLFGDETWWAHGHCVRRGALSASSASAARTTSSSTASTSTASLNVLVLGDSGDLQTFHTAEFKLGRAEPCRRGHNSTDGSRWTDGVDRDHLVVSLPSAADEQADGGIGVLVACRDQGFSSALWAGARNFTHYTAHAGRTVQQDARAGAFSPTFCARLVHEGRIGPRLPPTLRSRLGPGGSAPLHVVLYSQGRWRDEVENAPARYERDMYAALRVLRERGFVPIVRLLPPSSLFAPALRAQLNGAASAIAARLGVRVLGDVALAEQLLRREAALRNVSVVDDQHLSWMHPQSCASRTQTLRAGFTVCVPRPAGSLLMADGTHWCEDVFSGISGHLLVHQVLEPAQSRRVVNATL